MLDPLSYFHLLAYFVLVQHFISAHGIDTRILNSLYA
jgi:hypothetical protein